MAKKGASRRGGSDDQVDGRMRMMAPVVQLAFVVAAAVFVYSFVAAAREAETRRRCGSVCLLHPNYAGADRRVPSFNLPDMRGQRVSSDSLRGKVIVLNFWTKTCGPCLEEMPELADLARIVKDRSDVAVVTVSTDDGPDAVRDTLKALLRDDPPFPVLFDSESSVVGGKFGTHLFPETWIIDKRGVVRARFDGAREWSSSAVVELIDEVRGGTYCPVTVREGKPVGDDAKMCETFGGG